MPEGDTIFRAARTLERALGGQTVTEFTTALPQLARVHQDAPITGRTVEGVSASGKWLHIRFSGDLVLLTHMLMNGSWHIYRPGEPWQRRREDMRVLIATQNIVAVGFRIPIAEFHTSESLGRRKGLNRLGPQVLAQEFDEEGAGVSLKSRPELEVGVALLNQSVLAGLGNVFKSEVCFAARVNPFRLVHSLNGDEVGHLISYSRKYLLANVTESSNDHPVTYFGFRRTTGRADQSQRLWVYKRAGQPCRRCGEAIQMRKQGQDARVTFWCPRCQTI